jgi:tetratricopeptide (TPR) repeat protein
MARGGAPDARLQGLSATAARLLALAGPHLERGDAAAAAPNLEGALALAPGHPEVLRFSAIAALLEGRANEAVALLRRALGKRPGDALLHNNLGSALRADGDSRAALDAFERACELAPGLAAAWYNLGKACRSLQMPERAQEALERALALAPAHGAARVLLGDNLKTLGRIDEAAAAYRRALESDPRNVQAWWGIANLKTVRLDADDTAALRRLCANPDAPGGERSLAGFALAKALEDQGRYAEAWAELELANTLRRRQQPWDAQAFDAYLRSIEAAFAAPVSAGAGGKGEGIIFIVSLPRSGSTLVEQILASHPDVEGAGELPDLAQVIALESTRRGTAYPEWVGTATAADWDRLGDEYLRRTAPWRQRRPRSTDKGLDNWQFVGAAAAMLPGARFVDCRRDRLETALSMYRQWFSEGQRFSYDPSDIAAAIEGHARLMGFWHDRWPGRIHLHTLESLQQDPEAVIRTLLSQSDLAFDPRCLDFHLSRRSVRTASAAQVRSPLQGDTRRAHLYGGLVAPLRDRLR